MRAACASSSRASEPERRRCSRAARARRRRSRASRPRRAAASTSSPTGMRAAPTRRCWPCAARVPRASRCSSTGQPASVLLPYQRRLDALGIRFDARHAARRARGASLDGYAAVVVPPVGGGAGRALGRSARDERRRHQARARHVIPAAIALVGAAGFAGLLTRHGRAARLAALALLAGGHARRCSPGSEWTTRCARTQPRRPSRSSLALALGIAAARALQRRPLVAAVRRLPRAAVPVPGAHRQPGREPARAALRGHRRRLDRARARRAARAASRCACRRGALALPLLLLVAWEARLARLERERDRGRQGARVLRAAVRRPAGGARGAPAAAAAAARPPARPGRPRARLRGRRRLPARPPRHLVEPQADGLERVQLVLPRQLDLLRPVDLRPLPRGHDRARVRGAAVRHGAPAAASRPWPPAWPGSAS